MTSRAFADLSSAHVVDAVRGRSLIWPVGSTEQHGPHLPLSVDTTIAEAMAARLARELDGYALPALPIAARSLPQSGGGLSFPGTLHVTGESLIHYLRDVLRSLAPLPFARLIVLNGHYENESLLFEALDQTARDGSLPGRELIAFSWWSLLDAEWLAAELPRFPGWHAEHAGLTETSLMLHLRPDLVSDARPEHDDPPRAGVYLHPVDLSRTTTEGVLSSTTGATALIGDKLFEKVIAEAVSLVLSGDGLARPEPSASAVDERHKARNEP
jgi:creatinine amidohydrolase